MKEFNNIPRGTLVLITTGSYSDYYVRAVVRAERDVPVKDLIDDFLKRNPDSAGMYSFDSSSFLSELAKAGYFEDVDSTELHLGNYGNAQAYAVEKIENDLG